MHVAIIGAGAAGCFAAINLKRFNPLIDITIFERGKKPLAKVSVTGGGRCNLTNTFDSVRSLSSVYPRGDKLMKRLLHEFNHEDAYRWFEKEGVQLVRQEDNCVFPKSQDAMEIVETLLMLMKKMNIKVNTNHQVDKIEYKPSECFHITFADIVIKSVKADAVLVAIGGSIKKESLNFLESFSLNIIQPLPSLFSLCLPGHEITRMTGSVVNEVEVALPGTKHRASGPLLITHWGLSGPAVLKLSSYAARTLSENAYKIPLSINWYGEKNEEEVRNILLSVAKSNPQKMLSSTHPSHINSRLWTHLLRQSGLTAEQRWNELSKKGLNRLISTLTNNIYKVDGKNRFKEEFVTCGGVALNNINPATLECKSCPNLYFAGEVLDVDAITGGFNLQAAWTMGYVAAKAIANKRQP